MESEFKSSASSHSGIFGYTFFVFILIISLLYIISSPKLSTHNLSILCLRGIAFTISIFEISLPTLYVFQTSLTSKQSINHSLLFSYL